MVDIAHEITGKTEKREVWCVVQDMLFQVL